MRIRRNRVDENLPQPMLSPMIDMIFLLLVFFIISTMYMIEVKTIPMKLPEAAHTETVSKSNFVITVKKDGSIYLEDKILTLENLCEQAQSQHIQDNQFVVILRCDKELEYGSIIKILDALKEKGVTRFGLATESSKIK